MDKLMKDKSLPEDAKSNRYSDLLQEYQLLMAKKEKISKIEIVQHIIPLEANKVHEPTPTDGIPSTSSITLKTQRFTPSFALHQLTQSLHKVYYETMILL